MASIEMPVIGEDEVLDVEKVEELEFEEVRKMLLDEEMSKPSQVMNIDLAAKRSLPKEFLCCTTYQEIVAKTKNVSHLRLDRERIHTLGGEVLASLPRLTNLYLQFNRLEDISSLAGCRNLLFLTLAHNFISEVQGLQDLPSLMFLDLTHNDLTSVDNLVDSLPTSLVFLNIQGNPLCPTTDHPSYSNEDYLFLRECLAAALPRLKSLDDSEISALEKKASRKTYEVPAFSDEEEEEEEEKEEVVEEKPHQIIEESVKPETKEVVKEKIKAPFEEEPAKEVPQSGAATAAVAAVQFEEETKQAEEKEKLRAVVNLTLDPTADSTSALEASIVEARQIMGRTKEHIIQRSRMRINQDRKDQVSVDTEIKELRQSIQTNLHASSNGPLRIDAIYKCPPSN